MSKSKFISKIKEMFSNEDIFEDTVEDVVVSGETKEAFLDVTTDEGVMVRISEPVEVGSTVKVIDEEGEEVGNASDGQHLVEGIIVIVLDGLISEIIQPEQEEVVDEEVEEEVVEASAFATKESVNDLKATLEEMKSLLTSREKVIDGLIESFSKFSKEPNGKATKKETKFSSDLKSGTMSQEDKMKFFSDRKRK